MIQYWNMHEPLKAVRIFLTLHLAAYSLVFGGRSLLFQCQRIQVISSPIQHCTASTIHPRLCVSACLLWKNDGLGILERNCFQTNTWRKKSNPQTLEAALFLQS